jgi:hypothetical protein
MRNDVFDCLLQSLKRLFHVEVINKRVCTWCPSCFNSTFRFIRIQTKAEAVFFYQNFLVIPRYSIQVHRPHNTGSNQLKTLPLVV